MDTIEERLHDTSKVCFECYQAWAQDKKDATAREKLLEAIHELRKVASRLEIELAISERDEMTKTPIPVPPHRDARRKGQKGRGDKGNAGNKAAPEAAAEDGSAVKTVEIKKRAPRRKKASEE